MKKVVFLGLNVLMVFIMVGCGFNPSKQNYTEEEARSLFLEYSKNIEFSTNGIVYDIQRAERFNNLKYRDVFTIQYSIDQMRENSWDTNHQIEYIEGFYFTKDNELRTFRDTDYNDASLYSEKYVVPQIWYSEEFDIYIELVSITETESDNQYVLAYNISEGDLNNIIEIDNLEMSKFKVRWPGYLDFSKPQSTGNINHGNRSLEFDLKSEKLELGGLFEFQTQPNYSTFLNKNIKFKPSLNYNKWLTVDLKTEENIAIENLLTYYLPYEVTEFENQE